MNFKEEFDKLDSQLLELKIMIRHLGSPQPRMLDEDEAWVYCNGLERLVETAEQTSGELRVATKEREVRNEPV